MQEQHTTMTEYFNDTTQHAAEALVVAKLVEAEARSTGGGFTTSRWLLHQQPERGAVRRAQVLP
jgi:galactokinase